MNKIKIILAGILLVPVVAVATASVSAQAQYTLNDGIQAAKTDSQSDVDANSAVKNFVNIFLWVIGIISVIMIIWSGIRYTTSSGDSNKVTAAKNTLIYAIVGLILAVLSYAIVNFVLTQLNNA